LEDNKLIEVENPKQEVKEQLPEIKELNERSNLRFNQQSLINQMNSLLNPNYQPNNLNQPNKKEPRIEELKPVELNIKIDELVR